MSEKVGLTKPVYNQASAKPSPRQVAASGADGDRAGSADGAGGARRARDPRLDDVAKLYEKQFLREMVKAMRSTVSESGVIKANMAEKLYREELDNEYVEAWGNQGGIGLADMIYQQLDEKIQNLGGRPSWKPDGAIPLSNRDVSRVSRPKLPAEGQIALKVEVGDGKEPAQIRMPWAGRILSQPRLDDGQSALVLEHDDGVRSTFVFKGVLSAGLKAGDQLEPGAPVGVLSPEINSFFWNLSAAAAAGKATPPSSLSSL